MLESISVLTSNEVISTLTPFCGSAIRYCIKTAYRVHYHILIYNNRPDICTV